MSENYFYAPQQAGGSRDQQANQNAQQHPANSAPQVIVNVQNPVRMKNKWKALALCFFFGFFGAHKFYEEKTGLGILYLFTGGLFAVGCIVDFITLLFKPTQYSV